MSTITSLRRRFVLVAVSALLVAACGGPDTTGQGEARADGPIRIGWQTPWATQGQVVQVLKHTNALALHGVQGQFKGFTFGAPLNEAALAGEVDVLFTADQPAATLLSKTDGFAIVGRLMYNRVAIYVPPDSAVRRVADLAGKRVAMPFGAAAQRDALKAVAAAGLDPAKDIRAINLDILEHSGVVRRGTRSSWGDIDALVGFDPIPAVLEVQGRARMLHVGKVVAVVVMSKRFMAQRPDAAERFLKAYIDAWYYYARHQSQANEWFKREAGLEFEGHEPLAIAAAVEPNVRARAISEVQVLLQGPDMDVLQEAADFISARRLVTTQVQMREHVDQSLMTRALAGMREPSGVAARSG